MVSTGKALNIHAAIFFFVSELMYGHFRLQPARPQLVIVIS
jgi:hypothetical protein